MNRKLKTVAARLNIEMFVDCPNDECSYLIDLLRDNDTNGTNHNDNGALLRQMSPENGDNADFECDDVVCFKCKTTFNVKELYW